MGPRSRIRTTSTSGVALDVDATDIDHRLPRVHERLSMAAGALTLQLPLWIPGTHNPAGNVGRLASPRTHMAGLKGAGDTELAWQRDSDSDSDSVESFHLTIPPGDGVLNIAFEYLSSTRDTDDNQVIHDLLAVNWCNFNLYPVGRPAAGILFTPSVLLPAGWDVAGSLRAVDFAGAGPEGQRSHYPPNTLQMPIDSPLDSARCVSHRVLDGIEDSGWELSYDELPGEYARSLDELSDTTSLLDSIGLVAAAKRYEGPVVLRVGDGDLYLTVAVDYQESLRYPRLQRATGARDRLGEILASRCGQPPAPLWRHRARLTEPRSARGPAQVFVDRADGRCASAPSWRFAAHTLLRFLHFPA